MAKKIFIVDDDQDILESLELVLSSQGYEVVSSTSAKDAVERARDLTPDLIILDVMFPENSSEGFEVARRMHEDDTVKRIPILMLSAVNAKFNLAFSNKDRDDDWLPVAEFLEKPIEPKKLVETVKRLIG